jgi:hypothetical protein
MKLSSYCCSQESMESFSKSVNFIEKIIFSPKYECTMQRHIYTYGGNNIHACTLNFVSSSKICFPVVN